MGLRTLIRNLAELAKSGNMVVKDTVTVVEKQTVIEHHHHHYPSDKKEVARQYGANTTPVKELEGII